LIAYQALWTVLGVVPITKATNRSRFRNAACAGLRFVACEQHRCGIAREFNIQEDV
jgi:hypothetical protein